ncbi:hypothetical protein LCGC14_0837790 [marine sediment metagenome]
MDHANAHVMEYKDVIATKVIRSQFTHEEKEKSQQKSENMMHNKEQHQEADYYKTISESLKGFDEVLLFGPTNAKLELLNILEADQSFSKVKLDTRTTDKMSENQEHAYVRAYFADGGLTV